MTERASPFGTAVQSCGNIPSREKAMLENPQIFQHCKFKNIFSAEHGQSAAEAILNRAVPGRHPLSHGMRRASSPKGPPLAQCRKVCHHRPKPSPWGRWIAAKRQDGRGNAAVYRCAPPVKRQCWKIRRFSSIANLKIYFPLNMARAQRRPFKIVPCPAGERPQKNSPLRGSGYGAPCLKGVRVQCSFLP